MLPDFRDEWLSQLGQRINIPELVFDGEGICQLSLDQELAVTLFKHPEVAALVLFGQLPLAHLSPELMQQMLIENRNHSKITAPVLSLGESLDSIEVHFKLTQQELEAVDDAIGMLIGSLEYWRSATTAK